MGQPGAGDIDGAETRDRVALQALCSEYLDRVDHDDVAAPAVDLFTDDGRLVLGSLDLVGRASIADFFAKRSGANADSDRLTRHVAGPVRIGRIENGRAELRSTAVVYAGAGALPLPSALPSTICDFVDEAVRDPDGAWRFAARRADVVFVGEAASAFARPTPPQED